MQADANTGKENISRDDVLIPRVALMQGISPEVNAGQAESGNFYHSVAEADLGPTLDIIIVHHSKRYTLWNPRHMGGGVLARASDGVNWDQPGEFEIAPYKEKPKYKVKLSTGQKVGKDIGLGKWGSLDPENPDSAPAATLSHVLVCVAPELIEMGPFVIFLQRSAEPVAKGLLSKVKMDQAPIYGQVYTASSFVQPSAGGEFNQFKFVKNGHVQSAELYEELKRQNGIFTETGVKTNDEHEQADAEVAGGVGKGGAPATDSKTDTY